MSSVIITGWQAGFGKVSMTKLIRSHTGYSLARGKRCVDDLLEGKTVVLQELDDERAESFVADARKLGAICSVETGRPALVA